MTRKHSPFSFSISALVFIAGCAAFQAGQEVQYGRNALQKEQPAAAIAYFRRAADLDPNYVTSFSAGGSVWSYLGRAYYEAGNYSEAQQVLEKVLSLDKDNPMARLYLGLSILRTGDSERGSREIQSALKGIYDWLNRAASRPGNGVYWDPAREIRSEIQKTLMEKPEPAKLLSVAEWLESAHKRTQALLGVNPGTFVKVRALIAPTSLVDQQHLPQSETRNAP